MSEIDTLHNGAKIPADLVTCTEEILNGKLHFLCSGNCVGPGYTSG